VFAAICGQFDAARLILTQRYVLCKHGGEGAGFK
jgi:hypothetical protein